MHEIALPIPAAPAVTSTRWPLIPLIMAVPSIDLHDTVAAAVGGTRGDTLQEQALTPGQAPGETKRGRPVSIEQEELRGISRTVAEIHWLLLILVLLYLIFGGTHKDSESNAAISSGLFFYAALVMAFRYANFYKRETRWKIAFETCGMVAFITWVLWYTNRLGSPLLNAYLLPVLTAALTLGKVFTLLTVALIAACYLMLSGTVAPDLISLPFIGGFIATIAPVLLVAYITTMFSADIRYGLARAKVLSETDDLTGLLNVRGFAIAANRLFAQAARHGRPTSVLMIDCDNLKLVNDAH